MKRFIYTLSSAALFALPFITNAQLFDPNGNEKTIFSNIIDFINSVLIPFIIAIGFLAFVWGMFKYFIWGGHNEESKEQGKSLMIWATLGFVLIIVFWGIVNLLADATGLDRNNLEDIPNAPTLRTRN
jgi:uncharacterized membrane protein YidH (DUF202 family)